MPINPNEKKSLSVLRNGLEANVGNLSGIMALWMDYIPALSQADVQIINNELVIRILDSSLLLDILKYARNHCGLNQLIDLTANHWIQAEKPFEVVCHLLSLDYNYRVRVKVSIKEDESVPSLTTIYSSAMWYERECFDMFGIVFKGNNDLRRLLTDYTFEGHPLRKDFPVSGFVELRYDDDKQEVRYEPVKLTQEMRQFDFESPWEGVQASIQRQDKKV